MKILPLDLTAEADDPPEYDLEQAVRMIEHYLTDASLHPVLQELRAHADWMARRAARLQARQLSLAGRQAAGEAIVTLAASLGSVRRKGENAGEAMYLISMLTGYHLMPDKLIHR